MEHCTSTTRFLLVACMACLYGIEGKVVLLDVKSGETPLRVKIDLLGYHGVSDRMYELTGQHKYVTVPALPDSLNSETARDLKVEEIDPVTATAWLKRRSNESVQAYHYQDHVVFTHTSYLSEVLHHPSEETFTIGLSSDSKIWNEYPKGTTYCSHTGSLHFVPFPVQSCLMDHVVTLDCTTSGPLRCHHPEGSTMGINGLELKAIHPFITPFDYKIEMNSDITLCKNLRNSYYDESALSVTFPNGKVIDRSGKGMVPPLGAGSQLIDEVLFCDQMDYYVPPRSAFVGLMGTDLSFNYRPDTAKLEIYTTRHNSMRNSWPDVIVINICLLTFIHWLSDRDKSVRSPWTILPELVGIAASIAGLYFQKTSTGAYYRVADFDQGRLVILAPFLPLRSPFLGLIILLGQADPLLSPLRG